MTDRQTAAAFLASARPLDAASAGSTSGNDSEAVRIAAELREIVRHAAEYAPRNVQRTLGPSELGVHCDRQVVHKLLELPTTNHVSDPWPSVVGTALHAWLEEAFAKANPERWLTERRVWPVPEHPGTADLYDAQHRMVIDHKGRDAPRRTSSARTARRVTTPPRSCSTRWATSMRGTPSRPSPSPPGPAPALRWPDSTSGTTESPRRTGPS